MPSVGGVVGALAAPGADPTAGWAGLEPHQAGPGLQGVGWDTPGSPGEVGHAANNVHTGMRVS